MNKWTAAVALLLAAVLGGAYWVMNQKKQMALTQPAAIPSEADGADEDFETDSDLGDADALLDSQDSSLTELPPQPANPPSDKQGAAPLTSNDPVETLEDPDDATAADQDPIVIEDKDGASPPTPAGAKKAVPGP